MSILMIMTTGVIIIGICILHINAILACNIETTGTFINTDRGVFMKENFDATQFITFDIQDDSVHIIKQIRERFENLGFEVLQGEDIRKVKRQYFSKYIKEVFIELKDEIFLGDIELWPPDKEVTVERVINFVEQLKWIYEQKKISNLRLILTGLAEEGETSDEVLKVKPDEIMKGILGMSSYNFDILADNLILEIV